MKKIIILMIGLVLLVPFAYSYDQGNNADEPRSAEPQYYDNAKVIRVKYTQGEAYVKRSYDDGFEEAAVNLPIFEKDSAGTTQGRLEIYMGRLNYLRMDYDTEVVFDKVPELRKTDASLRLIRGGIYLEVENLDYERDIEVQTPDCGIFVLDKGLYRINVNEGGRTEVYVFDGIAEVAGDDYSRNVRESQKIVMLDGQVKERPYYFYSSDKDDFDLWNKERNNAVGYARYSSSGYLDNGYEEYEYELSRNGRWKYDSTYGCNIWIPYNVGVDWRPYYNGRWIWNPYYGYTWMSYDPWGYFTSHYGRWSWDPIDHWCWVPGYRWSPAWVSWFWDDYYYGWCPLSWWNRPIIIINNHWWRDYRYWGGIPVRARSTIIIRKDQLAASRINRVALRQSDITHISKKSIMFKGNAPHSRLMFSKVNVINAAGKTVVYKKNSLISTGKYQVMKEGTVISRGKGDKTVVYKYSGKNISKQKVTKYEASPYSPRTTFKSRTSRYRSSDSANTSGGYDYGTSTETRRIKRYSSGSESKSGYKSRSGSSSGSGSSGTATVKKSSVKSSSPKKSSGSKTYKVKKKKDEPSYSYRSSSSSSSYSHSSPYSSRSNRGYSSPRQSQHSYHYKSSNSNKYYRSTLSASAQSYRRPASSYSSRTYRSSSSSYGSSSRTPTSAYHSYSSYSRPSSYRSSYQSSSRTYHTPSSSYRSSSATRSYSRPSSSYRSSSSSSRSSSSHVSSSSHSHSSSSSYRKKG